MATKQSKYRISKTISDALDAMSASKASSARIAILGAVHRPELIPMALKVRQYKDFSPEEYRLSVRADDGAVDELKKLSDKFRISMEETLRLALEAYVYKL